jgi:hypothetical protein
LCEGHAKKLIETGERLDLVIPLVTIHSLSEGMQGEMVENLGENQFACENETAPAVRC